MQAAGHSPFGAVSPKASSWLLLAWEVSHGHHPIRGLETRPGDLRPELPCPRRVESLSHGSLGLLAPLEQPDLVLVGLACHDRGHRRRRIRRVPSLARNKSQAVRRSPVPAGFGPRLEVHTPAHTGSPEIHSRILTSGRQCPSAMRIAPRGSVQLPTQKSFRGRPQARSR